MSHLRAKAAIYSRVRVVTKRSPAPAEPSRASPLINEQMNTGQVVAEPNTSARNVAPTCCGSSITLLHHSEVWQVLFLLDLSWLGASECRQVLCGDPLDVGKDRKVDPPA